MNASLLQLQTRTKDAFEEHTLGAKNITYIINIAGNLIDVTRDAVHYIMNIAREFVSCNSSGLAAPE